jgi:hypothetical protein
MTSGAASGATFGALNYSINTKEWKLNEFFSSTVSSSVSGGISGGIMAGAMYGAEYLADEIGLLDKKHYIGSKTADNVTSFRDQNGKQYWVGGKHVVFSQEQISENYTTLGIPIHYEKTNFNNLWKNWKPYTTWEDILYNSRGLYGILSEQSRSAFLQFSNQAILNSDFNKYLGNEIESKIKKFTQQIKINTNSNL